VLGDLNNTLLVLLYDCLLQQLEQAKPQRFMIPLTTSTNSADLWPAFGLNSRNRSTGRCWPFTYLTLKGS